MPRYFFNTRIGDELILDPTGEELRDADQAWELARSLILHLLQEQLDQAMLLTASLQVSGEDGDVVLEFPFAEAMMDAAGADPPTTH